MSKAAILQTRKVEKVWGKDRLPPPFEGAQDKRIGEIWFEPPRDFDALLAKYLSTSEKLSVQVHPSDAAAPAGHRGKDECWVVLDAEPDATLAIGFREPTGQEQMREAALDGSIEDLLVWHEVQAGDFYYLPAGTVHAIGPGLSLVEIQQNSDITYRLYDYGRPRDLHLEEALPVADGGVYDKEFFTRKIPEQGSAALVEGPKFRLDLVDSRLPDSVAARYRGRVMAMPLSGSVKLGGDELAAGNCAVVEQIDAIEVPPGTRALLAQPL